MGGSEAGSPRRSSYSPLTSCRSLTRWEWLGAVLATLLPLAGGFAGARGFNSGIYKDGTIVRPSWSPSPKVFSPVWSLLYLAMGLASFLVWKRGGGLNADTWLPLGLYAMQLVLNWLWTPAFFGFGEFGLAAILLSVVIGLVVGCIGSFGRVTLVGAGLLVPYLVWLCFAAALNHHIVLLNGPTLNFTLPSGQ